MEEISWRQKSRALWLKAGDWNMSFFHKMANSYRKFNYMLSIMVEGSCYDSVDDMKHAVQSFYSSLLYEPDPWRPKVDGLVLPSLTVSQRMDLEILFFEEEVYNALGQCYGDKAP